MSALTIEPEADEPQDDVRATIRHDEQLSAAQRRALIEVDDEMVTAHRAKRRSKTE